MKKNDNNINGKLKLFCEKRTALYQYDSLKEPFSYGPFTYATDGRILVRVKRQKDIPLTPPGSKLRKTAKGAAAYFRKFPERSFKEVEVPAQKSVPKNRDGQRIASIGDRNFNMKFLTSMKRLPGLKVRITQSRRPLPDWRDGVNTGARMSARGELKPMEFVFDGGCGILMPTLANATKKVA